MNECILASFLCSDQVRRVTVVHIVLSCKSRNESDVINGFQIFPGYYKCVSLLHEYYTFVMSFISG